MDQPQVDILIISWQDRGQTWGLYKSAGRTVSGREYYTSANPAIMKDWVTNSDACMIRIAQEDEQERAKCTTQPALPLRN